MLLDEVGELWKCPCSSPVPLLLPPTSPPCHGTSEGTGRAGGHFSDRVTEDPCAVSTGLCFLLLLYGLGTVLGAGAKFHSEYQRNILEKVGWEERRDLDLERAAHTPWTLASLRTVTWYFCSLGAMCQPSKCPLKHGGHLWKAPWTRDSKAANLLHLTRINGRESPITQPVIPGNAFRFKWLRLYLLL